MNIMTSTHSATSTRLAMLADASGLCAYKGDVNPAASIADVRDKAVFVGTAWSPPV